MAEQKVYEIAQNGTSEDFTPIKQPLDEAFHRLTLLFENGDGSGVHRRPDRLRRARPLLAGMHRGDLIILAARPSVGKTAFALNMACVAAKAGASVAIFSLEMSRRAARQRMLSTESRSRRQLLRTGRLSDGDWTRVTSAMEPSRPTRALRRRHRRGSTVLELRAKARRLLRDKPTGC